MDLARARNVCREMAPGLYAKKQNDGKIFVMRVFDPRANKGVGGYESNVFTDENDAVGWLLQRGATLKGDSIQIEIQGEGQQDMEHSQELPAPDCIPEEPESVQEGQETHSECPQECREEPAVQKDDLAFLKS